MPDESAGVPDLLGSEALSAHVFFSDGCMVLMIFLQPSSQGHRSRITTWSRRRIRVTSSMSERAIRFRSRSGVSGSCHISGSLPPIEESVPGSAPLRLVGPTAAARILARLPPPGVTCGRRAARALAGSVQPGHRVRVRPELSREAGFVSCAADSWPNRSRSLTRRSKQSGTPAKPGAGTADPAMTRQMASLARAPRFSVS